MLVCQDRHNWTGRVLPGGMRNGPAQEIGGAEVGPGGPGRGAPGVREGAAPRGAWPVAAVNAGLASLRGLDWDEPISNRPADSEGEGFPAGASRPRVRLRMWLETDDGLFVGMGRAQLLANIAEHGSLKKASEKLGMSYRAAWGKLRESERVLGVQLVARRGRPRDGQELTAFGAVLAERYLRWFAAVEAEALRQAKEIFHMDVRRFGE
jgi:molybdate transport system regulatory protein